MNRVHDWVKGSLLGALLTACDCERDPPVSTGADSEGPQPTVLNAAPADSAAIPPVERAAEDSGALPTGSGRYVVQVGAYKHRAAAVAFAEDLSLMGLAAEVVSEAGIHRVRIGPLSTVSEARTLGDRLKRDLGLDYWVDSR